jgi:hypothetical protein
MKNLFLIILICLSTSILAQQKVKVDQKGNYTTQTVKGADQKTGKTFTDSKGNVYPIYKSVRGNLYYLKVSQKTGKEYKVYIKAE